MSQIATCRLSAQGTSYTQYELLISTENLATFSCHADSTYFHEFFFKKKTCPSRNPPRSAPWNAPTETNLKSRLQTTPNYQPNYPNNTCSNRGRHRRRVPPAAALAQTPVAHAQPHSNTTHAKTNRREEAYRGRHGGGSSAAAQRRRSSKGLRTRGVNMAAAPVRGGGEYRSSIGESETSKGDV